MGRSTRIWLAAGCAALAWLAAASPRAQTAEGALRVMDANGDGAISREEWTGRSPFERVDRDGDGVATGADLVTFFERVARKRAGGRNTGAKLNHRFFDFRLRAPDGKTLHLSDLRGRVVVLLPFATWCPPCLRKIWDYAKVFRHYRNNPKVAVLIYNFKDSYDYVAAEFRRNVGGDVIVFDAGDSGREGAAGRLTTATGKRVKVVGSMPQAWLIDRTGIVVQERTKRAGRSGFGNPGRFCADIERLALGLPVQSDWDAEIGYEWEKWASC